MFKILIIDHDKKSRQSVSSILKDNSYLTLEAVNSEQALRILYTQYVDLIICDVAMLGVDGYNFIQTLRDARYQMPIIITTSSNRLEDKKKGFLAGADDYMIKPIDLNELLLRIYSLFRRARLITTHKIQLGEVTLDYDSLSISHKQTAYILPQKEFYLLYRLFSSPDKILTRQQLMDEIWGIDSNSNVRTVDVHVNRLRKRLKDISNLHIQTIRGRGYKACISSTL